MKVKVKGLVFVGFAAMIFAANAMAANEDKTVTSKAFTEATYAKKANLKQTIDGTSATADVDFPSVAAVAGLVGDSYTGTAPVSVDAQTHVITVDVADSITDGETGLTTGDQVHDYVADQLAGNQADWAETVTTDPSYINNKPTQLSQFQDNIDAANAIDSITVGGTAVTPDSNKAVALGAAAGKGVDTDFTDTTSTDVPTTAAVADYVGTQLTSNQADWAETVTTDPSYINNKPTQLSQFQDNIDAANAIDSITVGGTAVTPDSNKAVALGAAAGKGADTSISSTSTDANVPTSKAVYDAIGDATGGLTIPAQNSSVCTAQHPCALVDEAGSLHWYTMAQDGYAGGELGDAQ